MCITVGAVLGNVGVIVADRRWTNKFTDGRVERLDLGCKLVPFADGAGFAAFTGNSQLAGQVLPRIARESPGSQAELVTILGAVYRESENGIRATLPGRTLDESRWMTLSREGETLALRHHAADGGPLKTYTGRGWLLTYPDVFEPGHPAFQGAVGAYKRGVEGARGAPDLVRAVAGYGSLAATYSESVSPEIEVGVFLPHGSGVLTGPAAALAVASDEHIHGVLAPFIREYAA